MTLCLITTISSFATAVDVTLAELKLEAFLPGDARTASVLLALSGERVPAGETTAVRGNDLQKPRGAEERTRG